MKTAKIIKTFTDRYPLIGPTIWMLSIQYFIIQFVVARDWSVPYSLTRNTISDLGNTACGTYGNKYVCSPLHSLMNMSFILLGITMASGSLFIYQEFKKSSWSLAGFSFMAIGGIGSIMVGLFPENTVSSLHIIGAGLPFLIGNVAIVLLGYKLVIPATLRIYTLISGGIPLIALVFLVSHHYFGLGPGGMERLTAYPQTVWLIVFGLYISKNHINHRSLKSRS
jgi:hypothetical membrane protein